MNAALRLRDDSAYGKNGQVHHQALGKKQCWAGKFFAKKYAARASGIHVHRERDQLAVGLFALHHGMFVSENRREIGFDPTQIRVQWQTPGPGIEACTKIDDRGDLMAGDGVEQKIVDDVGAHADHKRKPIEPRKGAGKRDSTRACETRSERIAEPAESALRFESTRGRSDARGIGYVGQVRRGKVSAAVSIA